MSSPDMPARPGRAQPERLAALDSVRGVAILLVVICHYFFGRIVTGPLGAVIAPFGGGGVILFFLLSGFLIERHLARDGNLTRYFLRRVFRIMPAYLLCIAVILVSARMIPNGTQWRPADVAINAVLLQDVFGAPLMVGIFWTLLIEIKFYAVAPFIVRVGRNALRIAPYLVIAANGLIFAWRHESSNLLSYLAYCLIGMQFGPWSRGELPGWALAALVAVAAITTRFIMPYNPTGLAVFVALNSTILAFALRRPFALPVLPFIGNISYSWYLYHAAVGYPLIAVLTDTIQNKGAAPSIAVAAAIAVTITIATLSFLIVEQPAIAFGRWIEGRLTAAPAFRGATQKAGN